MPGFWQRRTARQIRNITTNVFSTIRWYSTTKQVYSLSGSPIGSSPGTQNIDVTALLEDAGSATFGFFHLFVKAQANGATENDRHATFRLVHPTVAGLWPAIEVHGDSAFGVALGNDVRSVFLPIPLPANKIITLEGSCTVGFHGQFLCTMIGEGF